MIACHTHRGIRSNGASTSMPPTLPLLLARAVPSSGATGWSDITVERSER